MNIKSRRNGIVLEYNNEVFFRQDFVDKELELLDYYISFIIKNNLQEEFDKYVSDKLEKELYETKN